MLRYDVATAAAAVDVATAAVDVATAAVDVATAAVDVATAAATVDDTSSVSAVGALTLYFLPVSGAFKRGSPYLFDCGSSRFRVPSKEVHPKILTAVALRPPSSQWLHEHD